MGLTKELEEQVRFYLAKLQSRNQLADWLAAYAQELSDLPHDGSWELQADVWALIWQHEEDLFDENTFESRLGELFPRSPAIVQSWPLGFQKQMQTSSDAAMLPTEPLMLVGAQS